MYSRFKNRLRNGRGSRLRRIILGRSDFLLRKKGGGDKNWPKLRYVLYGRPLIDCEMSEKKFNSGILGVKCLTNGLLHAIFFDN
jgi:hypothetical protein